jgi:class 3 adenylate cyclase
MSSETPAAPQSGDAALPALPPSVPARRRRTLSIKSLILLMLLAVSIGSNVVVGVIGYVNGSDSLRQAAYDRLVEVRDSRSREMVDLFTTVQNQLLLAGRDRALVDAETSFSAGVRQLDADEHDALTGEQASALTAWYRGDFAARFQTATGSAGDVSSFVPQTPAGRYLQYHYAIGADPASVADAGDGSAWSAASARYHDYLQRMARLQQYGDVALIDASGRVVYTVDKHVDLGADLRSGPYSFTGLAQAFDETMSRNRLDQVAFSDFAPYGPSLDAQTSWVVAPIASADDIVGAIAVQLPVARIDQVMTGGKSWSSSGLGRTGETFLVGDDGRMRSLSRELSEHPKDYVKAAVAGGLNRSSAQRALARNETLGIQTVRTTAVTRALLGKTGTVTTDGYLGHPVIAAYAPLALPAANLHWVVVAQIDQSEALAPVDDFTARLAISSAIIVGVVCLISVIIAGLAVRPLRRLRDAARRIAAGEVGVQVDVGESDELVDVGAAFNDMSNSLAIKQQLIEQQAQENEKLLTTLMPSNLAEQYRSGAKTIVEDHQEVTVLFADVVGFEELSAGMPSAKALDLLNDIFRALDDAAEEHGVERVRTTRQGYLASCGLVVPRVDNARRCVDFALEAQRVVERFGAAQGAPLALRAGIDTGTVTSGLVGRARIVYDLWGEAVSLAYRLQGQTGDAGIFLTQRVIDKVPQKLPLEDAGSTETLTGTQHVWRIDPAYDPSAPAAAPAAGSTL